MIVDVFTQDLPPTTGGIAAHVDELTKNLSNLGVKIRLFIPCFEKDMAIVKEDSFGRLICKVYRGAPIRNDLSIPRILKTLRYIPNMKKAWKKINLEKQSDIIHIHNTFYEPIIIKGFKRPKVMTEHSSAFLIFTKNIFIKRIISKQFQQMDHIICPSEELANRCRKIGYSGNISFIPNGVDANFFRPGIEIKNSSIIKIKDLLKGKTILLCPRRLEPKNGVHYLLKALLFLKKKNYHLLLAGDGTMMNEYRKFVEENRLLNYVTFLGNVSKSDMREYISISSLCIFPSLYEAISIACLECMASGKSIVATNAGGLPYLVNEGANGSLVPARDAGALAAAISHLIDNESLRENMGLKSREIAISKFSWINIAKRILEIYSNLLI